MALSGNFRESNCVTYFKAVWELLLGLRTGSGSCDWQKTKKRLSAGHSDIQHKAGDFL